MHRLVDLTIETTPKHVKTVRMVEIERGGRKREAGFVGGRPELGIYRRRSCGRLELLRSSLAAFS